MPSSRAALRRCEAGGTGFVELLLVVSLIAVLGVAGARVYSASVRDQFTGEGGDFDVDPDDDEHDGDVVALAPAPGFPTVLVAATRVLGTVLTPFAWVLPGDEAEEESEPEPEPEQLQTDEDAAAVAIAPTHAKRRSPHTTPAVGTVIPGPEPTDSALVQLPWWILLALAIAALLAPSLGAIVRRWRSGDSTASPRATSRRTAAWSRSSCAAATSPRSTSSKLST